MYPTTKSAFDLNNNASSLTAPANDFSESWMQSINNRRSWSSNMPTEMAVTPASPDILYGDLSYWDDLNPLRPNAFMDDYRFASDRAGQVKFNLNSNDFDTYLQIIDFNTGRLIATDDDSGPGSNSEITLNIQAGTDIVVRVTSYAANAVGYYSIAADTAYTPTPPPNPNPPNPNPTPPPTNLPFSPVNGYGLVDAGAAVARSLGQNAFPEVRDLGGVNWGNDLVNAPEAWSRGYTGHNIIVAVVDTGVDYTHPDLDSNIWRNNGEVFGNGVDDDRNGYIDDVMGWDFVNGDNNPMDEDTHGTHVAGTIAAENNGFGVTGVAYNAKIMPVRVLGEDGGTNEWVARGIRYAADNRANVINLSLGGSYSQIVIDAVRYATQKGAIVVMAAGNESEAQPGYPASIATEVGITVGAIDQNLSMGWFSNLAGADPDMAYVTAPGVGVYSTVPGGRYDSYDGTSMAAPHVAGVAALMLSANQNLTPTQVRQIMVETAFRGNSQQTTLSMLRSWSAATNPRRVAPGEFYGLEQQSADREFEADWGLN